MLIFHGRFLHSLLPGPLYLGCNSGHRLALLFPLHSWMVLLIWLDTPVFPGALQLESWLPFICKFGLPGSWASLTKADGFLASGPPQWVLGTESCSLKHPPDIWHLGHPPQTCVHNIFFFLISPAVLVPFVCMECSALVSLFGILIQWCSKLLFSASAHSVIIPTFCYPLVEG